MLSIMIKPNPCKPKTCFFQLFGSANELCPALAMQWTQDVVKHVSKFLLPYKDPKTLDSIEIEDEEEIKIYDDGKLHHLKRFEANITEAVYDDEAEQSDILRVNVTLNFRLLRTSYVWQNFFSDGILSMYHTCSGQHLPITIFDVRIFSATFIITLWDFETFCL